MILKRMVQTPATPRFVDRHGGALSATLGLATLGLLGTLTLTIYRCLGILEESCDGRIFASHSLRQCAVLLAYRISGERKRHINRGRKKHINSFNINFLAPTQNPPFWAPRKKFMCLISWERTQKRHININFFGAIWGSKRGSQTGHFRPQKV